MPTMTPSELRSRLTGVVGFPVTPFSDALTVDLAGLRANVAAMTAHPFCCIVAAGGTGELYSLNTEEHTAVVRTSVEATAGRTAVIAGVGGNIGVAVEQATKAWKAGADGILALPPYYPHADEAGLLAYYAAIGAATPLGLLVYSRDWVNPGPGFVAKLAELPTAVAWKDGQGDARRYQIIMDAVGDRLHWVGGAGDDLVGTYYRLGIRCYTSSISNVSPKLALLLHDVAAAGDEAKLARADAPLRGAALRLPRAQEGLRGLGDEGDDAAAGPGRRPGASAAGQRQRERARRAARDDGDLGALPVATVHNDARLQDIWSRACQRLSGRSVPPGAAADGRVWDGPRLLADRALSAVGGGPSSLGAIQLALGAPAGTSAGRTSWKSQVQLHHGVARPPCRRAPGSSP